MEKTYYRIEDDAGTLVDGFDQNAVIEEARQCFQLRREEDGHVGAWEEQVVLVVEDENGAEIERRTVQLTGVVDQGVDPRKEHGTF